MRGERGAVHVAFVLLLQFCIRVWAKHLHTRNLCSVKCFCIYTRHIKMHMTV